MDTPRRGAIFVVWLTAWLGAVTPSGAGEIEVPVDVGVGPSAYYFFGPVNDPRWPIPHFGLKLDVQAVIDRELIARNASRIPAGMRRAARSVDEVRISPSLLIPDALILSPKVPSFGDTAIYGITWRPISAGLPLLGRPARGASSRATSRVTLGAGLLLTYAFVQSDSLPTTHFVRPGVDLMLEVELAASESFLVSFGWASQLYVPQRLGSFGIGPLSESIFHVGQAFLQLHFRFPYRYRF